MPSHAEPTAKNAIIGCCLWLSPVVITAIISASQQPPGQRLERAVSILMCGPATLLWALFILNVIITHFKIVSIIWGPLIGLSAIYVSHSTSDDRYGLAFLYIICFPFWFGGLLFIGSVAAYFVTSIVRHLFYSCLSWRWIISLPRYRNAYPFAECTLCERCQEMLKNSSLLFGTWKILARTEESHQVPTTLDEMRNSQPNCHLCATLLGDDFEREDNALLGHPYPSYGTLPSLSSLESGNLIVKIWIQTWPELFDSMIGISPSYFMQLSASNGSKQRKLDIEEGKRILKSSDNKSTGSSDVLWKANRLINSCEKHEACQNHSSFLPTRLIHVASDSSLRLVESSELLTDGSVAYLALSHCWGGDIDCRLLSTNYNTLREGVEINALPKNFQEAISITRRLRVPYLWIDSLCIVQDSNEDWAKESSSMGHVFANARCTISATASKNSQGGCFRDRSTGYSSSLMTSSKRRIHVTTESLSIRTLFETRVESAPLTKRAWAFQERLLSRRILHFCSDTILFECNRLQASEFNMSGSKYAKEPYIIFEGNLYDWGTTMLRSLLPTTVVTWLDRNEHMDHSASRGIRGALHVLQSLGSASHFNLREQLEFNKRWYELVSAYTERALTRPTDKLMAFSGIAGLIQKNVKKPYLAGLWESISLEFGLLWRVRKPAPARTPYCAPSWSWASSDGPVELLPGMKFTTDIDASHLIFEAKVEQAVVYLKAAEVFDATSMVDEGFLHIVGPVAKVQWTSTEPRILRLGEGSDPQPKHLEFFPDWDYTRLCAHQNPTVGTRVEENDLVAIHILTTPYRSSTICLYGLVLKLNCKTSPLWEYERYGTFCAIMKDTMSSSKRWPKQKIRIL